MRPSDRWTLYADLLVGGNKLTQQARLPEQMVSMDPAEWDKLDDETRHRLTTQSSEANRLAWSIGGGVDMKVRRGIAIRLGNFQLMRTAIEDFNGLPYSTMVRFTTGFVLRAGEI
ncbi:MAG: hypothetical protein U0V70_14015 [Terriglobia bacterium]